MSHVEYFNVSGYFNSQQYLSCLDLNLEAGRIGNIDLAPSDVERLKGALRKADTDSDEGKLAGVVNLIEHVEGIVDKYGLSSECKHHRQSVRELIDEISSRPEIVRKYGLEQYVKPNENKPTTTVRTTTNKKKCK